MNTGCLLGYPQPASSAAPAVATPAHHPTPSESSATAASIAQTSALATNVTTDTSTSSTAQEQIGVISRNAAEPDSDPGTFSVVDFRWYIHTASF